MRRLFSLQSWVTAINAAPSRLPHFSRSAALIAGLCSISVATVNAEDSGPPVSKPISAINDVEVVEDTPALEESVKQVSAEEKKSESKPPVVVRTPFQQKVDQAIEFTSRRVLSTEAHSPWQIAHGMLALRHNYVLKQGGEKITALDWIASGPSYRGMPWFLKTNHGGKGQPFVKPYWFEGHPNQFVALFTFCDLPRDFEFQADKGTITLQDIIDNAKMEVNDYEEVTWTLWFLCHYLEPEEEWQNQYSQNWSIERLIREQMRTKVTESACGGMHGLFAISKARNKYMETGKPLRGVWLEADMHLKRYISATRSMQNRDGSFSADYYKGREWADKLDKRVSTTGHTLEFLMMSLPDSELKSSWVRSGVNRISDDLINSRRLPLEPGGMYHALDALILYRQRTDPNFDLKSLQIPQPTVVPETVSLEQQGTDSEQGADTGSSTSASNPRISVGAGSETSRN